MKVARIHEFGAPDVIRIDDVAQPTPNEGEILVRVAAAGVGQWDALLREGKIAVSSPLPLILGSDVSGVVEAARPGVTKFNTGDEVYGVTTTQFLGAYAEYAVASETMMARKPTSLSFAEAASAPVVAVTAWQMLFDHAHARAGQTVLIPQVGTVLPLADARVAHQMLAGAPHARGKIVLNVAARHDPPRGHLLQPAPGAA
jgi:NADPH:quinone reductase-like Zn-dependent oxidoreductase